MVFGGREADHGGRVGLGTRVRAAIRRAGINHSEVARSIGLEPSKLSKSLAGTRKFRVEEISRIAELTDVTTDWLTRGRSAEPPRRTRSAVRAEHVNTWADSTRATRAVTPSSTHATSSPAASANDAAGCARTPDIAAGPAVEPWMSKGTRNRRRIVAAAWELYADRGIDSVRVHDVAEASGLSVSAITYHFRTKTQLLEAALRHSLEIIANTRDLLDPDDPVEVLLRFARVHAGVDTTVRRVWSIWMQSWARAVVDERSRLNLTAVYGEWLELISGVIVAGQRRGQVREGDTDLMVKSVCVFIDGLGIARGTGQMGLTDADALTMIETFLATHILAPDSDPPADPHPRAPDPEKDLPCPDEPAPTAASRKEGR